MSGKPSASEEVSPSDSSAATTASAWAASASADTFFSYTAGRSRYGKTELAIVQFVHLARSGYGGFFLDPHGDALDPIEPYLAEPERVIRIDLRPGRSLDELPGWNLFEVGGTNGAEARGGWRRWSTPSPRPSNGASPRRRGHPRPAAREPPRLRPFSCRAQPRRAGTRRSKAALALFDEVQSYDGGASGNLAALLEQSAKFGLRASSSTKTPSASARRR